MIHTAFFPSLLVATVGEGIRYLTKQERTIISLISYLPRELVLPSDTNLPQRQLRHLSVILTRILGSVCVNVKVIGLDKEMMYI